MTKKRQCAIRDMKDKSKRTGRSRQAHRLALLSSEKIRPERPEKRSEQ
ncbi:hypothetical protein DDI_3328 [Dickeya dianthicola RNS04.9]|nr:hypothetical protein DDI_3328 [Dickeya dianthicola RNS04.9]